MKIGIIIPDRGDRPEFMQNCRRMMDAQTVHPWHIVVVDEPPVSKAVDITVRYRKAYNMICEDGVCDVYAFIENDDWYSPKYLETMLNKWVEAGEPDILGTRYTVYYHLMEQKYFTMRHDQRSSMMNTLIKPGLNLVWPVDNDPYTDIHLWLQAQTGQLSSHLFEPETLISVGMKHGVGLCGGTNHTDNMHRFINDDNGFLQNTLDEESFKFYSKFAQK